MPVDLHATMFGGIPNYEIDHLERFWAAFPSLREDLFRIENEHTSNVKVDSILDSIKTNSDVQAFEAAYYTAFDALEQWLYDLLIENRVDNVHTIKAEITNRIFELCKEFDIVDRYIVYKAFDEIWEQISIDLEAIRLQGLGAARVIESIEVYDKKEGDAVPKGEDGKVIPFSLIQKHLFTDEFVRMETLSRELANVTAEYDSFWEDMDEELKDQLKKKSDNAGDEAEAKLDTTTLKKKYQEVLESLSNDITKQYISYLALKPKEKLVFQQDHAELIWPEESEKGKNGVYKPAAIKAIIEQIKNGIEIAEDEDDYKMRHLYLLGQQISAFKKQIKVLKTELDTKAREAIESLSDDEIKMLLKEKWLTPAMQSINDIPTSIKDELNRSIQRIVVKYQNPISTLDTEISYAEKELSSMLKNLCGNDFDMAAIHEFEKLLGGEDNE